MTALGHAFEYAEMVHQSQIRKGTTIPYISHLMAVCALVLENGGGIDAAVAALLHDTVEDHPVTVDDIRERFGPRVAQIVESCSDTTDHENKAPWHERKRAYLARLRAKDDGDTLLVSLADKIHNARCIVADLQAGADVWKRFTAGRDHQLWYYTSLGEIFSSKLPGPLAEELRSLVERMRTPT